MRLLDAAGSEIVRLTLVRACAAEGEGPRWHPGEIAIDGFIACGEQAVEILEIQPDGKRPMTLAEFRRGNSVDAGDEVGIDLRKHTMMIVKTS